MDRFAALQAFAQVVETGSFARAARKLDASTSSLSRLVADLEQHLGARLLHRTTRRLSLTEVGQSFYERCVQLLSDWAEAEALAQQSSAVPSGTLKLTCPFNLVATRVAPAISRFAMRWPQVKVDVLVADRVVDLVEEGIDLAIRVGPTGSDRVVARRLGTTRLVVAAAPSWVARHGLPGTPADLGHKPALTYAYAASPRLWRLAGPDGQVQEVRVQGPVHANSGELLTAAAIAGVGAVFEPEYVLTPAIAAGSLVRLLPDHASPPLDIWAVYPSRRHLSAKVRRFVDDLADDFSARPAL